MNDHQNTKGQTSHIYIKTNENCCVTVNDGNCSDNENCFISVLQFWKVDTGKLIKSKQVYYPIMEILVVLIVFIY